MAATISYIDKFIVLLGFLLNSLLLFLILRFSRPQLGNYRKLLQIFACNDISMVVVHLIGQPASVSYGSALGVFSRSFPENKYVISLSCGFLTIPFTLMNINFLHRFWTVRSPYKIPLFSNTRFAMLISFYPIGMIILWSCASFSTADNSVGKELIKPLIANLHGVTIGDGWLVVHYWSVVPVIFVYIPFGLGLSLPLLVGAKNTGGMDHWFTLISIFPALDAIVIISLMKDYRDGLLAIFYWIHQSEMSISSFQSSHTAWNA